MVDVVALSIAGSSYEGWKEVRITRSLKAIASGFSLSLTDRWTEDKAAWIVKPGDSCKVKIGGSAVISGYVDSISSSLSSNDRTITVDGREKTCDLVDCSVEEHEFQNISLYGLAKKISEPYGVNVKNPAGVSKLHPRVAVSNGETVFAVLEKYAKREGVLLTSDGLGTLLIAKVGGGFAQSAIVEGKNLLSASATFDNKARFSQYIVRGQNNYEDMDASLMAGPEGRSKDLGISRKRLLVVNAEASVSREDAQKRANWELVFRQANAWTVSARVQGWRDAAGKLWAPNSLVKLYAPRIGIDATLLITDVAFSQSIGEGTVTELRLTRKDAFIPEPSKPDEAEMLRKLYEANL